MAKTPDDRESLRQLLERGQAARRNMQEILDRVDARRAAEAERRERRRRALRKLLPFAR
jgi:DNA-binding MarR family transcriptional regulator